MRKVLGEEVEGTRSFSEEELSELCMGGLRIIEKAMRQQRGAKKYLYNTGI